MDDKQLLAAHEIQIKSLEKRMQGAEKLADATHALALSVKELTINQTQMLQEQQEQGKRIKALEDKPIQKMDHIKEKIIDCIITGIVTGVLGIILGYILR